MNENLIGIKAAIAGFFTAVSAFLGWQGVLAFVWLFAMCLDYLSGTLPAWLSGEWDSAVAREGAKHKAGMFFVVIVAGITDITICIVCEQLPVDFAWPVLVFPLVLAWYILTELGSILENAVKMGAPIPKWLMDILSVGLKVINAKASEMIPEMEQDTEQDEIQAEGEYHPSVLMGMDKQESGLITEE